MRNFEQLDGLDEFVGLIKFEQLGNSRTLVGVSKTTIDGQELSASTLLSPYESRVVAEQRITHDIYEQAYQFLYFAKKYKQ